MFNDIKTLLAMVRSVSAASADAMTEARWLTPVGVEIRHPGDTAEMLPGDDVRVESFVE
jgi:hypothetical protein